MMPDSLKKDIDSLVEYLVRKNNQKVDYRLSTLYSHIKCGRCSGIPYCCIFFFLFFWMPLFSLIGFKPIKAFIKWWPPIKCNYVPCFFCYFFKNKIKIHVCKKDDEKCCGIISRSTETS